MASTALAFVIPTRNRRGDLSRMLGTLAAQTRQPDQVIVVDGSDPDQTIEDVCGHFPGLQIDYVRVFPPSLAAQRNAGMQVVRPEITVAGYLDDDLVLESTCVEAMARFWEAASPRVGGASFNITNVPRPPFSRVKGWFGLDGPRPGAVLPSGYQTMICPVDETIQTDWLFGGATMWRREVIRAYPYDEWFVGTGFMEDVDYSHAVRQQWELWVVADARLQHLSAPIRREMFYRIGEWEVVNRLHIIRKHPHLSTRRFAWAVVGQMLVNLTKAIVQRDRTSFQRLRGNLSAVRIVATTRGALPRLGGIMK